LLMPVPLRYGFFPRDRSHQQLRWIPRHDCLNALTTKLGETVMRRMDRLGVCVWLVLGGGREQHSYDGFGKNASGLAFVRILIPFLSFAGAFRIIP
jgi:hypothetical protein